MSVKSGIRFLLCAVLCMAAMGLQAQQTRVYGYVVDTDNRGVDLANVYVRGTTVGTTTNRNGYYDLMIGRADSATIVYSLLGYKTIEHTIVPGRQQVVQISVVLEPDVTELGEVQVRTQRHQVGSMETLDAQSARLMPDASGGSIESLLITFAGVSQTNELSSQYSVRGGNFDENCVYVNGIEVYRPQLIRAGQQEGLSFVNPDMVENLQFSAGGFDARYGDKMSSVLDITYKTPTAFEASVTAGLLGATAYVGTGGKGFTQMHGIRYKTNQYLLGTLDTKGTYKPNFIDYQTYMTWRLDRHDRWRLSLLGNFSQNSYKYIPQESSTSFGTYGMARNLTTYFEGSEADLFRTAFGAVGVSYEPNRALKLSMTAAAFHTNERETYDITGQYMLSDVPQADGQESTVLGVGTYHEHARNRLDMTVATLSHQGRWQHADNRLEWGASLQVERIDDRIGEWEWRDSVGYTLPHTQAGPLELYYNLHSNVRLTGTRLQAYVQDQYRWRTSAGLFSVSGGVRMHYWDYNSQLIASPRA
ncbi:MAG: carboxypeptidase-like regulatory domain-containing protein, partial [Paludibacteraceae bacterium]|nr:carboxypeptidase-like regulatory domain-containing protein [Paludibacteraceae bacterium]